MNAATVLRIGHTGITVSDLDRSMRFYRDVLGFEVSEPVQVSGPLFAALTGVPGCVIDVAFARGLGQIIELLCYRAPADRKISQLRACDPGFWHLCLKVRDIDAVIRAVLSAGFEPLSEVQTVPEGPLQGMRASYVRDPDGVALELLEEPRGVSLEELHLQTLWRQ